MKKSFCTNVFPYEQILPACRKLREMGYDGVEFWDQFLQGCDIYALKKELDEIGLETAQICPYFDLTGTQEALEASLETARQYVNWARILSCRNIRVFTGSVNSREVTQQQFAQATSALQAICGLAPEIYFVLEAHRGQLAESTPAIRRLLEAVNRPNLKVNLQVPLDDGKEEIIQSAQALKDVTVHLHAHNWHGSLREGITFLDDGDYDFEAFLRILYAGGFNGYVSIEHGNHLGRRDPFEVAAHEAEYLKALFERMEK